MWGYGENDADLDLGGKWNIVPAGKSAAVFQGLHFDYLNPWQSCNFPRGSCTLIPPVAAELAALFIARHLPVALSHAPIPPDLNPAPVTLTAEQKLYVDGLLRGLTLLRTQTNCGIDLRWDEPFGAGIRHLGS